MTNRKRKRERSQDRGEGGGEEKGISLIKLHAKFAYFG